jgi:RimJ/RimL family protein N-acetyltransferase
MLLFFILDLSMLTTFLPRCRRDGDITLRPLRISDGPSLSRILEQEDILKSGGRKRLRRTHWIFFYFWLRRTFFAAYCIEHQAETIGFVGLHNLVPGESAEISLVLFDPAGRRRGYGTRAFKLLCGNSFTISFADTLIAKVRNDNGPARSFWTSLGFVTLRSDGDVTVMELRGGK